MKGRRRTVERKTSFGVLLTKRPRSYAWPAEPISRRTHRRWLRSSAASSCRNASRAGSPLPTPHRSPGQQKKNGRLVVARRPFPIGLSKGEALLPPFFFHLPPVGCSTASGGRGGALVRSPGRMAIPPGSSIRALRVRSGRGPTFRTAPRGARSGRMKHATGFTCSSRGDHQDQRMPEPLVASAFSPDIPLEPACWPPL